MSDLWLLRLNSLIFLGLLLLAIWAYNGLQAAVGCGILALISYYFGQHERDHHPTPPSEPPPAARG